MMMMMMMPCCQAYVDTSDDVDFDDSNNAAVLPLV
jgi:hypothetical protein